MNQTSMTMMRMWVGTMMCTDTMWRIHRRSDQAVDLSIDIHG
nr:hypothetical protein [uncultured Porphyromonas sp.]